MIPVRLSRVHLDALEAEARRAAPYEACALLLGLRDGATVRIDDIRLSPNVTDDDPMTAFEVDPGLHLMLQRAARAGGPQVIGVWHSHPNGVAKPSAEDGARSEMPAWCWLITAVRGGASETRAFMASEDDPHRLEAAILEVR